MRDSIHSWLSAFCHFLEKIVIISCVLSFSFATLLYVVSVCFRFFAQNSFPWIDQLTSYLFAIAPILGAGLAIRSDENLKIEVFKKLSKKWYILLITRLFSLVVSIFFLKFFYQAFIEVWFNNATAIVFLKRWMVDIPYIFFFIVSIFFYLETVLNALKNRKEDAENLENL